MIQPTPGLILHTLRRDLRRSPPARRSDSGRSNRKSGNSGRSWRRNHRNFLFRPRARPHPHRKGRSIQPIPAWRSRRRCVTPPSRSLCRTDRAMSYVARSGRSRIRDSLIWCISQVFPREQNSSLVGIFLVSKEIDVLDALTRRVDLLEALVLRLSGERERLDVRPAVLDPAPQTATGPYDQDHLPSARGNPGPNPQWIPVMHALPSIPSPPAPIACNRPALYLTTPIHQHDPPALSVVRRKTYGENRFRIRTHSFALPAGNQSSSSLPTISIGMRPYSPHGNRFPRGRAHDLGTSVLVAGERHRRHQRPVSRRLPRRLL